MVAWLKLSLLLLCIGALVRTGLGRASPQGSFRPQLSEPGYVHPISILDPPVSRCPEGHQRTRTGECRFVHSPSP